MKNRIDSFSYAMGVRRFTLFKNDSLGLDLSPLWIEKSLTDGKNGNPIMSYKDAGDFLNKYVPNHKSPKETNSKDGANVIKTDLNRPSTKSDSLSYAYGIITFYGAKTQNIILDPILFAKAIYDKNKGYPLMTDKFAIDFLIKH